MWKWSCNAFPDDIPIQIKRGFDHREPLGDETVLYEMAVGAEPQLQDWEENVKPYYDPNPVFPPVKKKPPRRKS